MNALKGNLVPSRKQVAHNHLELKEFQDLCSNNIVLLSTDNTTVVAYINKEGGMKLGPLCALLWRILTWCARRQVSLKAWHIPGRLNVIADKISRLGQTIQTEWSLHPEFQVLVAKPYAPGGTSPKWTCLPPGSTTNCHSCVTGSRPPGMGSGCTQPVLGRFGPICLPTSSHLGHSGGEAGIEAPQRGSTRSVYEAK